MIIEKCQADTVANSNTTGKRQDHNMNRNTTQRNTTGRTQHDKTQDRYAKDRRDKFGQKTLHICIGKDHFLLLSLLTVVISGA